MQETEVSTYCGVGARCFSADKMAFNCYSVHALGRGEFQA